MSEERATEGTAIALEVLPASYGDCLLLQCPVPAGTWRLLIDMGPDETWPILRERLAQLPPDADGRRHLDLAIVSHIDHDHIGAAHYLFSDDTLGLTFGDVWFNGRQHLEERGVVEGEALNELLTAKRQQLPWNRAFAGGPVVTPGDGKFLELNGLPGYPRLTVLSPTPKRLTRLAAVWDAELQRLRRRESNTEEELDRAGEFPDLEALATHPHRSDRAPANGSSIALLVEHQGASVLLAADSFPTVLGTAILGVAQHRGVPLPFRVDAHKLSHHGSRANLMTKLLGAIQARHYVVSTDNTRFGHPSDETLARVVLYGGQAPALWFNYPTEQNLRWANESLRTKYGFVSYFPDAGNRGISIPLAQPP